MIKKRDFNARNDILSITSYHKNKTIAITQLIKICYKVIEHIIFHKNIHCTTNLKRDYTQLTPFELLPSETRKILTCKLYGFTLSNHFILKPGSQ